MYKSLIYQQFGAPTKVLKLIERIETTLAPDELLVKMKFTPINPSDLIPMTGAYSHRTPLPAFAGYEGVGRVVAVGSAVDEAWLGRRVLPLQSEGTWQEFVRVNQQFAVPVLPEIEDVTAAQLYINPLTAWLICIQLLHLSKNQVLVLNAAGSAIGRIFTQLSQILGFRFIGIVRNDDATADLLNLGAEQVINSSSEDVASLLRKIGVDAAIDCIGGSEGTLLAQAVQENGKFHTLGLLSGRQIDWQTVSQLPIEVGLFHLRYWNEKLSATEFQTTMLKIQELVRSEQLLIENPIEIFDFEDFQTALVRNENFKGKILLDFDKKSY